MFNQQEKRTFDIVISKQTAEKILQTGQNKDFYFDVFAFHPGCNLKDTAEHWVSVGEKSLSNGKLPNCYTKFEIWCSDQDMFNQLNLKYGIS